MSLVTIDSEVLVDIQEQLKTLTAFIKLQHAVNGLTKYIHEEEVTVVTGLSKDSLRTYRRYGVFTKKTIGKKRVYIRKEVNDFVDGKLNHKVFAMREQMKEDKLKSKKQPKTIRYE